MNMIDNTYAEKNDDMTIISDELDLEIIELEDKIAPRDWNVYALLQNITK